MFLQVITRVISCYDTENQRGLQNTKPSLSVSCADRFILITSSNRCSYRSFISCYNTENQRGLQNTKPSLSVSCADRFILIISSNRCSYRSLRVLYPVIILRIKEIFRMKTTMLTRRYRSGSIHRRFLWGICGFGGSSMAGGIGSDSNRV